MKKSIKIAGVEVPVLFTFYTYKLLGEFWKKETIQEVMDHIVIATSGVSDGSLAFSAMTVFSDIVSVLDEEGLLSEKEIQNHLFLHPEDVTLIVDAFVSSLTLPSSGEVDQKKKKHPVKEK